MNNNRVYFYIDESQDADQKEADSNLYLCISLILSEDKDEIYSSLKAKKHDIRNDQFMGVNKKLINKLLHYNDDNDDVKNEIVNTIRTLFFRSYISRMKFNGKEYDATYYILLKSLIKDRIIKYKDRTVVIRYEQNSKISKIGMEQTINTIMEIIKKENKHVISSHPILEKVTKEDFLISIPDYTLGLFLTYLEEKEKKSPLNFKINRFEKIRSKIRLFIDLNIPKYYSRKTFEHL